MPPGNPAGYLPPKSKPYKARRPRGVALTPSTKGPEKKLPPSMRGGSHPTGGHAAPMFPSSGRRGKKLPPKMRPKAYARIPR